MDRNLYPQVPGLLEPALPMGNNIGYRSIITPSPCMVLGILARGWPVELLL